MINSIWFNWCHLPRTGGTATASWVRKVATLLDVPIDVDNCETPAKHDNLMTRMIRKPDFEAGQVSAMNFKRLRPWLQSSYRFAKAIGLDVPQERYLDGEFFSLRTGSWCAADWWLEYFDTNSIDFFLPVDDLEAAWRTFVHDRVGRFVPEEVRFGRENEVGCDVALSPAWQELEMAAARQRNPRWVAIERHVFAQSRDRGRMAPVSGVTMSR